MKIEHDDDFYVKKAPKPYSHPINGGNIERLAWEENNARCAWYKGYPVNRGRLEQLAWEHAHGWDR